MGEDHSLLKEFPDFKGTILALAKSDELFYQEMKKYDALDKEIRKLEMRDSPISDDEINQLKHVRSALKDDLYQRLIKA